MKSNALILFSINSRKAFLRCALLSMCLVSASSGLWSQTISMSEDVNMRTEKSYFLVGELSNNYILVRDRQNSRDMMLFDNNLNNYQTLDLKLDEENRSTLIDAFGYEGYMYVIYQVKEKRELLLRINKYNHKGILRDSVMISKTDAQFINPSVEIVRSEMGGVFSSYSLESEHELQLSTFDLNSFKTLYSEIYVFDGTKLRSEMQGVILAEDGTSTVITRNSNSLNPKKRATVDFFKIFPDDRETLFDQVFLGDRNIVEISYQEDEGAINLFGFSSSKANDRVELYFTGRVSENFDLLSFEEEEFGLKLLRSIYGRKVKPKRSINGLSVKNVMKTSDGGFMYIAEIERIYSRRPSFPSAGTSTGRGLWVDYYFDDIVLFSFDKNGKPVWQKVLHKKQFSQDDDGIFSSFFIMENPSSIRIIFNDEIKQENTVSEYLVDATGYYERNSLFTTEYEELQLRFQDAIQEDARTCLVPSENNGRMNIVRISY